MYENFDPNSPDPFGWDEPEPQPEKISTWKKIKYTIIAGVLIFMFRGLPEAIERRAERQKKYKHVIKQGWFGEYSEWHER